MGKDALSIHTAQHWFNRFKNGNFELDDLPRSGRPLETDMDVFKQLIEEDPRLTKRCLAEQLGCSHTTAETHLGGLGKTCNMGFGYHMSYHRISSRTGSTLVWNY
jgi:hypothetical protein